MPAWQAAGSPGVGWDGAASQRGPPVRAVGLPLVIPPVAAPALNPAARVFEESRRRVEGRVSATLADKVAAVEAYLQELVAAPARRRSLAGGAWIRQTLENATLMWPRC